MKLEVKVMMYKTALITFLMVCITSAAHGDNIIELESKFVFAGTADLEVRVLVDNDEDVLGISFAGAADSGLTLTRIELGAELLALNVQDEFFEPILKPDYFGAAMITDFEAPYDFENQVLGAGEAQHCFSLFFDVQAGLAHGTELDITLANNHGTPPVESVFSVFGVTHRPTLVSSTVTIVAAPVLTDISPDKGASAGGTEVTLTGENFMGNTTVTMDGVALDNLVVVNSTTITGEAPAHAAGAVDVMVHTNFGSDTLAGGFTYFDAPTLSSVTPNEGHGDEPVTIIGTGFTDSDDMTLTVGGTAITGFTVDSDTELTCTIPACPNPLINQWLSISVTTSGGSDTLTEGYLCLKVIQFRRGDSNCDSEVDLSDAINILLYLFDDQTVTCLDALDSNDDGSLNLADTIYLLSFLFEHGDAPGAPYPGLGEDPTADAIGCADICGQ